MEKRNKIYRTMITWFYNNDYHMFKSDYFKYAGKIMLTELYMFEPDKNNKSLFDHREMQIYAILFSIEMTNPTIN